MASIPDLADYIRNGINKGETLLRVLALPEWAYYRRSNRWVGGLQITKTILDNFNAETCGNHMADWAIHKGKTDSLELLLHHAHLSRCNMWKERRTSSRQKPDFHPLNQSIYCGRMDNIDVLLRYGYNLEFTETFYKRLVKDVVRALVHPSQSAESLDRLQYISPSRRTFLVLLVIRTLLYGNKRPETYCGYEAALRTIWSHNTHSFLCKNEFLTLFGPCTDALDKLEGLWRHYSLQVCSGKDDARQPFSLAHQSRCKVRQLMARNMALPSGVNDLLIPKELKSYLLFE